MVDRIREENIGLGMILFMLIMSIVIAILFGMNDMWFKSYAGQVANLPGMLPEKVASETDKIWRYAQRFHFHAGGIAAYSLGLFIILINLDLTAKIRRISTIALGLHNLYPFAWLVAFYYAPLIGRNKAKSLFISEIWVYISIVSFIIVMGIMIGNIFFKKFRSQ